MWIRTQIAHQVVLIPGVQHRLSRKSSGSVQVVWLGNTVVNGAKGRESMLWFLMSSNLIKRACSDWMYSNGPHASECRQAGRVQSG